jgi:predicted membrane-bound mannosyltransferase
MRVPKWVRAALMPLVLPALAGGAAAARAEEPHTPAGVLAAAAALDGRLVTVTGRLGKVRAETSRKGDRYYTFELGESPETLTVLAVEKPPCAERSTVTVAGRFESGGRHVDATEVVCR